MIYNARFKLKSRKDFTKKLKQFRKNRKKDYQFQLDAIAKLAAFTESKAFQ